MAKRALSPPRGRGPSPPPPRGRGSGFGGGIGGIGGGTGGTAGSPGGRVVPAVAAAASASASGRGEAAGPAAPLSLQQPQPFHSPVPSSSATASASAAALSPVSAQTVCGGGGGGAMTPPRSRPHAAATTTAKVCGGGRGRSLLRPQPLRISPGGGGGAGGGAAPGGGVVAVRRRVMAAVRRTHSPKSVPSPLSRPVRLQNLGRLVGPPPISDSPTPYSSSSCSAGSAPQDHRTRHQGSRSKSPPQQPRLLAMPALPPSCRLAAAAAAAAAAGKKRRRSSGPSSSSSVGGGDGSGCARGRTLYLPLKKRRRRSANNGNGRGGRSRSPSRSPSPKRSSSSPPLSSPKKPSSSPVPAGGAKAPTALPPQVVGGGGFDEVPTVEVRTVSPTVRGIAESARILLSRGRGPSSSSSSGPLSTPSKIEGAGHDDAGGLLSFPTETVYSLACCVSVKNFVRRSARGGGPRSNSASSTGSTGSSGAEEALVKAEGRGGSLGGAAAGCGDGGPAMSRLLKMKGRLPPASPPTSSSEVGGAFGAASLSSISDRDVPLVYLHDPSHSRRFARFSKPKTFVLKPPAAAAPPLAPASESSPTKDEKKSASSSDPKDTGGDAADKTPRQRMRPAVTFSESREVLDRLAAAFWPGPAVVYAPVKVRRTGGSTRASVSAGNFKAGARASSTSDGGEESVEEGGGGGNGRGNEAASASARDVAKDFAPILPRGALVSVPSSLLAPSSPRDDHSQASAPAPQEEASRKDEARPPLLPKRGRDKGPPSGSSRLFVGMRCPSHPLARRVLAEAYSSAPASAPSKSPGGTPSRRGSSSSSSGSCPNVAVVGFDASVPSFPATSHQGVRGSPPPTTARDVCASLLSSASSASSSHPHSPAAGTSATTTVHVLNGEDKREIFSVPTCQYGADPPPPALLIDDETRTIYILLPGSSSSSGQGQGQKGKRGQQRVPEIRREDVRRALLKPASLPETSASSTKDTMAAREARAGEEDKRRVMAAALSRWNVVTVTVGGQEGEGTKREEEKERERSSSSRAAQCI